MSAAPGSSANPATQQLQRKKRVPAVAKPVEGAPAARRLPGLGETVFGFRLTHELGRGAFACVFLAQQADLAGRPVVLKVSAIDGDEPQTLARLQHTHIVPIYSVHENPAAELRAVCMPYFGGASLADVLRALYQLAPFPERGSQLLEALRGVSGPAMEDAGDGPTALAVLADMGYVRAVMWLTVRLAEAVQHAHRRGVLHRDLKPSNVLMAADGEPMLLDFNVACNLRHRPEAQAALGGTVAYMSPEHLRALGGDPDLARLVDHRSDIYSLGMVLYEMLTGSRPFSETGSYSAGQSQVEAMAEERARTVPSLRGRRPDTSWGLESVLRRCLDPDPTRRYQKAEHLAEDLRRLLADRPLAHAPELSRAERVRKWLRRHPRLTSSGSVGAAAALLLFGVCGALVAVSRHRDAAQEGLWASQAEERRRAFEAGTVRALCLLNTTTDLGDHAREGRAACEEVLGLYAILERDDWQEGLDWRRLASADRARLAEDARELLLLLAWSRAGSGRVTDPGAALALVDRAAAVADLPPSRALEEDRARYLEARGDAESAAAARRRAADLPAAGARDRYLLATTFARAGRYIEAVAELDEALRANPRHYWSLVQRGLCQLELGRPTLAAADFGACVGLWPEFAWGYANRGYALGRAGNLAEAVRDYTAALDRDADFAAVRVNRGMALLELRQYGPALADFDRAAATGRDDAFLHLGRGAALEGLTQHAEADAAFAEGLRRASAGESRERAHLVYGFAVAARLPRQADRAFAAVLETRPGHAQAWYGRAMVAATAGRDAEAVRHLDEALRVNAGLAEARRYRAILHARLGNTRGAWEDLQWCLEREPESGAVLYAAACVAARLADKAPEGAGGVRRALAYLGRALAAGYGRESAAGDPDLATLREEPEFRRLVGGK